MPSYTSNYDLAKPLVNDPADKDQWGTLLNGNMDTIDSLLAQAMLRRAPLYEWATDQRVSRWTEYTADVTQSGDNVRFTNTTAANNDASITIDVPAGKALVVQAVTAANSSAPAPTLHLGSAATPYGGYGFDYPVDQAISVTATDGKLTLYVNTNASTAGAWVEFSDIQVSVVESGTQVTASDNAPASPNTNDLWLDTSTQSVGGGGGSVDLTQTARYVESIAALKNLDSAAMVNGQPIIVRSYVAGQSKGGGVYWYDSGDSTTADDGVLTHVGGDGARYKLWHNGRISLFQGGCLGNGVREDVAIQRTINACYDNGITLHVPAGRFAHEDKIIIADRMTIEGDGMDKSELYHDFSGSTQQLRGVVIGTYGPANSSSPAHSTAYPIQSISGTTFTLTDASAFQVGDIIAIEGATSIRADTPICEPNLINEVTAVTATTVTVGYSLDGDDYSGGNLYRMNTGEAWQTDATGRAWPLLIAAHTVIKDLAIVQKENAGWPAAHVAFYKTHLERVRFTHPTGGALAGNPVARSDIRDCIFQFGRVAWEFAYESHDTHIINPRTERIGDDTSTDLRYVGWCNVDEGAKRIHVTGGHIDNGHPTNTNYITVLTGPGSRIRDVTISAGNGQGVYGQSDASIEGCTVYYGSGRGISGFSAGQVIGNRVISMPTVTSTDEYSIQNNGTDSIIRDNILNHWDGSQQTWNVIDNMNGHIVRRGNETFNSVPEYRGSYYWTELENATAPAGEVELAIFNFPAGSFIGNDSVIFDIAFRAAAGATFQVRTNTTDLAGVVVPTGGQDCRVKGRVVSGGGRGTSNYHVSLELSCEGGTVSEVGARYGVSWSSLTDVGLFLTGLPGGTEVRHYYTDIRKEGDTRW